MAAEEPNSNVYWIVATALALLGLGIAFYLWPT